MPGSQQVSETRSFESSARSPEGPICNFSFFRLQISFAPQEPLAPFENETLVVSSRDIDSTVSVVGRALLPVKDGDGQECPSYKQPRLG